MVSHAGHGHGQSATQMRDGDVSKARIAGCGSLATADILLMELRVSDSVSVSMG